eukprot:1713484-Rhodomonas_salina.1
MRVDLPDCSVLLLILLLVVVIVGSGPLVRPVNRDSLGSPYVHGGTRVPVLKNLCLVLVGVSGHSSATEKSQGGTLNTTKRSRDLEVNAAVHGAFAVCLGSRVLPSANTPGIRVGIPTCLLYTSDAADDM